MKKVILSLVTILLLFGFVTGVNAGTDSKNKETETEKKETKKEEKISCDKKVTVHLFWGNGCPHCETAIKYFDTLKNTYGECFELAKYETWYDKDGRTLLEDVAGYLGEDVGGVPYIVIGEDTFSGYSSALNEKIENAITSNANNDDYVDVVKKVQNGETGTKNSSISDTIVTVTILLVAVVGIVALVKTSKEK